MRVSDNLLHGLKDSNVSGAELCDKQLTGGLKLTRSPSANDLVSARLLQEFYRNQVLANTYLDRRLTYPYTFHADSCVVERGFGSVKNLAKE